MQMRGRQLGYSKWVKCGVKEDAKLGMANSAFLASLMRFIGLQNIPNENLRHRCGINQGFPRRRRCNAVSRGVRSCCCVFLVCCLWSVLVVAAVLVFLSGCACRAL